jgi:hypothetical protein
VRPYSDVDPKRTLNSLLPDVDPKRTLNYLLTTTAGTIASSRFPASGAASARPVAGDAWRTPLRTW